MSARAKNLIVARYIAWINIQENVELIAENNEIITKFKELLLDINQHF